MLIPRTIAGIFRTCRNAANPNWNFGAAKLSRLPDGRANVTVVDGIRAMSVTFAEPAESQLPGDAAPTFKQAARPVRGFAKLVDHARLVEMIDQLSPASSPRDPASKYVGVVEHGTNYIVARKADGQWKSVPLATATGNFPKLDAAYPKGIAYMTPYADEKNDRYRLKREKPVGGKREALGYKFSLSTRMLREILQALEKAQGAVAADVPHDDERRQEAEQVTFSVPLSPYQPIRIDANSKFEGVEAHALIQRRV